ncbi:expressed unknown protein [Seminavis robusta]|uniref:Uncharacterized protein n=1 Tax=Seminavis robusta TaxID=568900 RepID=A0A9N8F077_9STRA|nr:expressed unknown protein [Seminavis robusta]|eukprot:Sro2326_g323450.1 n/a (308) ;mRNA; r:8915-9838
MPPKGVTLDGGGIFEAGHCSIANTCTIASSMDTDITKSFGALKLSSSGPSASRGSLLEPFCFNDFFKKGSAGRAVFTEYIVPFLTLDDLVSGSSTCRQMNAMCRTYIVGEILEFHSMDHVSRNHKMELGKLIMIFVSPKYNVRGEIHRRFVRKHGGERFWARLYHPSLMPDIVLAMTAYFNRHGIRFDAGMDDYDWDANRNLSTPLLIAATFGDRQNGVTDVTTILRYLLMKQDNKRLILEKPPGGPRYWYIHLFGDPCPRVTKTLWLKIRWEGGRVSTLTYHEDQFVDTELRAGPLGVEESESDDE